MKFAAFSYAYSTNLGDEIQTLSAAQYLPRVDFLVERDRLHWYRGSDPTFMIFNGWFIQQPTWPPPDSISPLFVAFHAANPELLIAKKYASYFKRHEPIGCRSLATVQAFREIGVDAYFSACLTLTLERRRLPRTNQIYAVDVEPSLFAAVVPKEINERAVHLSHEYPSPDANLAAKAKWSTAQLCLRGIQKWEGARPLLGGAAGKLNQARHSFRVDRAEELLATYSSAKLVITSRLHCALPCIALGTPVVLLRPGVESDPRFEGLRDFVRCHSDPSRPIQIDWQQPEPNSDVHLSYVKALRQRCKEAVKQALASEGGSELRSGSPSLVASDLRKTMEFSAYERKL